MDENQACCAHLHVEYRTEEVDHDFGTPQQRASNGPNKAPSGVHRVTRGWWACRDCATKFSPSPSVASPLERATGSEPPTEKLDGGPDHLRQIAAEIRIWLDAALGRRQYSSPSFRHADADALDTLADKLSGRAAVLPSPEPT